MSQQQFNDFLINPALKLPVDWSNTAPTATIIELLEKRFEDYRQTIEGASDGIVGDPAELKRIVRESSNLLLASLRAQLNHGNTPESWRHFQECITLLRPWLTRYVDQFEFPERDHKLLFRLRRSTESTLPKKEMFHIPFESRHRVAPKRFSAIGLPCLYLGSSTYICWQEFERPSFHEIVGSAFWYRNPAKPPRVLNLYLTPDVIFEIAVREYANNPNHAETWIEGLAHLWPLLASCSIIVKNRKAAFVPEYIIPQMLLEAIRTENLADGIAYLSMHSGKFFFESCSIMINYVFPAKEISSEGICPHLESLFAWTDAYNWQLLAAIGDRFEFHQTGKELEIIPGLKQVLNETDFGLVTNALATIAKNDRMNRNKENKSS